MYLVLSSIHLYLFSSFDAKYKRKSRPSKNKSSSDTKINILLQSSNNLIYLGLESDVWLFIFWRSDQKYNNTARHMREIWLENICPRTYRVTAGLRVLEVDQWKVLAPHLWINVTTVAWVNGASWSISSWCNTADVIRRKPTYIPSPWIFNFLIPTALHFHSSQSISSSDDELIQTKILFTPPHRDEKTNKLRSNAWSPHNSIC